MEENKIESLVVVEQLPIIKQQLQIISDEVDKEIKHALSLECDEDSKVEVKQARARLNKIKTTLEDKRKQVKNAIMNPYTEFENIYNDLVKNKLEEADKTLKERIDEIEILQKDERELELKEFAQNWFVAKGIEDYVSFEDIKLNITLSASMKSLEDKIIEFCEKVFNDLKLIEQEEYKEEILLEYKHSLDFTYSKLKVLDRYAELETLKQKQEMKLEQEKQEEKIAKKVESALFELNEETGKYEEIETITAPKEIIEDDEIIEVQFKVKSTKEKILKLRDYLKENEINYE